MEEFSKLSKKHIIILGVLLFIGIIYLAGVFFFNTHFLPNTYAGPINVSQLSVNRAEEKIQQQLGEQPLNISENDTDLGYITLKDLEIQAVPTEPLGERMNQQNSFTWPVSFLFGRDAIDISSTIETDENIIEALIPSLGVNNSDRQPTVNASINKSEDGSFTIDEEIYGEQISAESLSNAIKQTIGTGQNHLLLETAYNNPTEIQESESINQRLAEIENMLNTSITLEFDGNSVTIPQEEITEWIYMDEANNPQIDVELVEDYILELNRQYSGLFLPRYFDSTYQGTVVVQPGTYGWFIDRFDEAQQIVADIKAGAQVVREPVIGGAGYGMGDYVGGNYVEVDIAYQMMFIYRDGQLVMDTPIVSGIIGAETVPGAYQVWNKEQDTDLVGYNTITEQDYVQPVSYWIAFDDQAQGIHDASWQSSFGGNAYMTAGSLGCINTPPGVMGQVYDLIDYGMPVIVF